MGLLALVLAAAAARAQPGPPSTRPAGRVEGRVILSTGAAGASLGGIVVFLVPSEGDPSLGLAPRPAEAVSQKNAKFEPSLLVVEAGRKVDFVNDDSIDHDVFSFSNAKSFDLGLYPRGEKRSVVFDVPGPVLVFCSIHESMNAVVYVTPNRLFAVTTPDGSFAIDRVPAGRYHLRTWHTDLPEGLKYVEVRDVDIESAKPVEAVIDLAGAFAPPGAPR